MTTDSRPESCGLVLAGGGARGAYEAGVLHYLYCDAPAELRERARFKVLCGTSVGALNVSALAAAASSPTLGVRKLTDLWKGLALDQLLPMGMSDLVSVSAWLLGRRTRESLLPGLGVKDFVNKSIDWEQIHRGLHAGDIDAVSLSCTHVPTGRTVVFYETRDGRERPWSRDPHVSAISTRLGPSHARASAAIPLLFPPVSIDGIPYVDGGLRQNTPLSPALRLGSTRILVVGVSHAKRQRPDLPHEQGVKVDSLGRPIFMMGKVLNALMLDHVDYDLIRLEHFNHLIRDGERVFGKDFVDRLNHVTHAQRNAHYRYIPHLTLRPSRDIGAMAAEYARGRAFKASDGGFTARLIRALAHAEPRAEADLTSYLLFDGGFAQQLMTLGIEDAAAHREQLMRFFDVPLR
jgi:NTE family protein